MRGPVDVREALTGDALWRAAVRLNGVVRAISELRDRVWAAEIEVTLAQAGHVRRLRRAFVLRAPGVEPNALMLGGVEPGNGSHELGANRPRLRVLVGWWRGQLRGEWRGDVPGLDVSNDGLAEALMEGARERGVWPGVRGDFGFELGFVDIAGGGHTAKQVDC